MKESAKYAKIVEWSEEDQCYVGSAPGLILGGCHGNDEKKVFDELCEVVEEAIELYRKDGKPFCSMKITQDVREYAQKGMQEKSREFIEQGGELYRRD
jgi:predicted RNase H-like HicB family nuclease